MSQIFHRLGPGQKAAAYIIGVALAVILPCCGGVAIFSAAGSDPQETRSVSGGQHTTPPAEQATREQTPAVDPGSTSPSISGVASSPPPSVAASPTLNIEKRQVTETEEIPFTSTTVEDASLAAGTKVVRTQGVPGVRTLTYEVTLTNGVQTDRRLIAETVTRAAVTQVVAIGTRAAASNCDPNYSGCVPIASDVDCAGGSGNGPAYVSGPVRVIGTDIYDLDRDHDGLACE